MYILEIRSKIEPLKAARTSKRIISPPKAPKVPETHSHQNASNAERASIDRGIIMKTNEYVAQKGPPIEETSARLGK